MANPAFNRGYPGYRVHEAHRLSNHALVAERTPEHDLSCGDISLDTQCRGGTAEAPIQRRVDLRENKLVIYSGS
jgi:hypothetical protein